MIAWNGEWELGNTKTLTENGGQLASEGKEPRTARGQKTLRKILDAALGEFGEVRPVCQTVFGVALVRGVAPLARGHVAAGAGVFEEVKDDALGWGLCGTHFCWFDLCWFGLLVFDH